MLLLLGLTVLAAGGELLVRGASRIAMVCGVSPLVIGLTVVAFGTSTPEAAVSVFSSLQGAPGVAVGNVMGSNIFNILVVLGLSALVAPLTVHQQVVRFDAPLGVGVTLLLAGLCFDGSIGRLDGGILLGGILVYTFWAVRKSRTEPLEIQQEYTKEFGSTVQRNGHIALQVLFIAAGVGLLVFGSDLLVDGASAMARRLGVSDLVIGLTIVAAGTSLPELATSLIAGVRGERDIAVGNVVGSNLFNILCVLGLAGLVAPRGLSVPPEALRFDLWVMLGASALALPVFFTGYRISRWEGAVFVMFYVLYLGFLVLSAGGRPGLAAFNTAALFFIVPMVILIIGTAAYQLLPVRKK
jgi:cation:H+ antiporter